MLAAYVLSQDFLTSKAGDIVYLDPEDSKTQTLLTDGVSAEATADDLASEEAAERWFKDNDPEGVAFEYPVSQ